MGGGLVALLLASLTFQRCFVWQNERSLWASERRTPRMTANLAAALLNDGERVEAEQWLSLGVRLSANPRLSERDQRIGRIANLANLAILYGQQGRDIDARLIAQDIFRTMPAWPVAAQLCTDFGC